MNIPRQTSTVVVERTAMQAAARQRGVVWLPDLGLCCDSCFCTPWFCYCRGCRRCDIVIIYSW
jgi:hypothetical protein